MSESLAPERPPVRRRNRPPQWRHINFPTRGLLRIHPAPKKPVRQRARDLWESFRLTVRSATLWIAAGVFLLWADSPILAAAAIALSVLFFLFRPNIYEIDADVDEELRTNSAEFLSTMAGATGVPMIGGNRLTIYNNGDEFYPAMLKAISQAKYSITMEQYIFAHSETGREFAEAFAERARNGVSVKLLVDAVGGAYLGKQIVRILLESGCELRWFHPIRWYNLHRVNNRNHRKSLIIDGCIAFTGGAGIDDHWRGSASGPHEWRDLQICIEGPGVIPLQTGFAFNWLETAGELLTGPAYYPVLDTAEGVELQTVLSSPKGDLYTASILYALTILCARQSLYITNPYFVPGPRTLERMADAAARGVDIKIILAGRASDTWWAYMNSSRLYGKLMEAGVEVYEYMPTMIHQKTMVVDHIWATVGTTNFDHRSFRFNEESNVCFCDPEHVNRLREIFFEDLKRCRRVELARWRARGIWQRAGERFAWLLQDQV